MKYKLLFVLIVLFIAQAKAQSIVKPSQEVCDSISSIGSANVVAQYNVQNRVLKNYREMFAYDSTNNGLNKTNKLLLELVRYLSRNCPEYKLEHAFLSGETNVLDLEELFTSMQIDTIQQKVAGLREKMDFGLLIISVDDLYPYNNLKDFAIGAGYVWSVGNGLSKNGIVVAFSKKLKRVRISTSSLSKKFLSDKDAQDLIDNVLLPKFSGGKYYEAMIELIKRLEDEL
jgi:uncharacterized protein